MEFPLPIDDDFVIYGAENCKWCKQTKLELQKRNIVFVYHDIDSFGIDRKDTVEILRMHAGLPEKHRTIPIVYRHGTFLGGYESVMKIIEKQLGIDEDF